MTDNTHLWTAAIVACGLALSGCAGPHDTATTTGGMTDEEVENLVKRSWPYVAMYNVNNKGAMQYGGWNLCDADTQLKDHTLKLIARPNNDSLYITCMLDVRKEPVILDMPAFASKYVSLMITGYDHYVNIPMSTRQGDFEQPEKMLIFSERTDGYERGEQVEGVDRYFEATGDFLSAVFRVMPHANEPERFERIKDQMQSVELLTLSELRGEEPKPTDEPEMPPVGEKDVDVFEKNLLEVMQFVFNHTTFDPDSELDQKVLAAYEPLGVAPGQPDDPDRVETLDGRRVRQVAERIEAEEMARADRLAASTGLFKRKGEIGLDLLLFQSVFGPIGQPAVEAVYPAITTTDGAPMNAQHDYVIRMTGRRLAPRRGLLVDDPLRHGERLLHPQRPQEVQRRRERGHEARRGRGHRDLHRRREARERAGGELAAARARRLRYRRGPAPVCPRPGEVQDLGTAQGRADRGRIADLLERMGYRPRSAAS